MDYDFIKLRYSLITTLLGLSNIVSDEKFKNYLKQLKIIIEEFENKIKIN